jgi:hypothetical protein|nr:MAG TPA: hypothetical protein [Caudoviricetes sp.]
MKTIAVIMFVVFLILNIICFAYETLNQLMEYDYSKRRYKKNL